MRYAVAGESNNPILSAFVSGVPAGLRVEESGIASDVSRWAHARGVAAPQVNIASGVTAAGRSTGAPIAFWLDNNVNAYDASCKSIPQPNTAELAGSLKLSMDNCADVSLPGGAIMQSTHVAAAGVAKEFLAAVGVEIRSFVVGIADVRMRNVSLDWAPLEIETSAVRCPLAQASRTMENRVAAAREAGDTLGGQFRLVVTGLFPGLGVLEPCGPGLKAELAQALFSVADVNAVEFGVPSEGEKPLHGSLLADVAMLDHAGFTRMSNGTGGLEGSVTSGMPLVVTVSMDPSPYTRCAVQSLDMSLLASAQTEDPGLEYCACAVPSAAVVAEGKVACVLANAYLAKFGEDCMADIMASINAYKHRLKTAAK